MGAVVRGGSEEIALGEGSECGGVGAWSVSHAAGVMGAQGDYGVGRGVSQGSEDFSSPLGLAHREV